MEMETRLEEVGGKLKEMILFMCKFLVVDSVPGISDVPRGPLKLKSASCQFAYWEGGQLQIANYLTRRTFSTNPATLEVIRFFITSEHSIPDALVEFGTYSREEHAQSRYWN